MICLANHQSKKSTRTSMQLAMLNKVTLLFCCMSNFCKLFYKTPPLFYCLFLQLPIFLLCFVASTNAWYYGYGYGHNYYQPYYHNIKINYGPKIEPTSYEQYVQVTYKCSLGTDEELDTSDVANNPNCEASHTFANPYKYPVFPEVAPEPMAEGEEPAIVDVDAKALDLDEEEIDPLLDLRKGDEDLY